MNNLIYLLGVASGAIIALAIETVVLVLVVRWKILRARIKKILGIRSPSALARGFDYEYDYIKAEQKREHGGKKTDIR